MEHEKRAIVGILKSMLEFVSSDEVVIGAEWILAPRYEPDSYRDEDGLPRDIYKRNSCFVLAFDTFSRIDIAKMGNEEMIAYFKKEWESWQRVKKTNYRRIIEMGNYKPKEKKCPPKS
jgi:hypothetical protein